MSQMGGKPKLKIEVLQWDGEWPTARPRPLNPLKGAGQFESAEIETGERLLV